MEILGHRLSVRLPDELVQGLNREFLPPSAYQKRSGGSHGELIN